MLALGSVAHICSVPKLLKVVACTVSTTPHATLAFKHGSQPVLSMLAHNPWAVWQWERFASALPSTSMRPWRLAQIWDVGWKRYRSVYERTQSRQPASGMFSLQRSGYADARVGQRDLWDWHLLLLARGTCLQQQHCNSVTTLLH